MIKDKLQDWPNYAVSEHDLSEDELVNKLGQEEETRREDEEAHYAKVSGKEQTLVERIEEEVVTHEGIHEVEIPEFLKEAPPPIPIPDFLKPARATAETITYMRSQYLRDAMSFNAYYKLCTTEVGADDNIFVELAMCTKILQYLTTTIDLAKTEEPLDLQWLEKLGLCLASEEIVFDKLILSYERRKGTPQA